MKRGDNMSKWKHDGVRVIPGNQLDPNTAQTPGMDRKAAINAARVGAQKIWAGTVTIHPNAKTGAHHHGALESVIYVVRGRARMRWGEHLEFVAEAAGAGRLALLHVVFLSAIGDAVLILIGGRILRGLQKRGKRIALRELGGRRTARTTGHEDIPRRHPRTREQTIR